MGAERRAKAARRQQRGGTATLHRHMERDGVFRRVSMVEFALRSPGFSQQWHSVATLRDGTEGEVQDIKAAHALALEVLAEMGVDTKDVRITLQRRFNNLSFFCRPDPGRIAGELGLVSAAA